MNLNKKIFLIMIVVSLATAISGISVFATPGEFVYWLDPSSVSMPIMPDYEDGDKHEQIRHAIVSTSALRLRSEPSTDSEIITLLPGGTNVLVLYQMDEWINVYFEGQIGYLNIYFVRIHYGVDNANASYLAEQIVAHSLQFLGTPYVWGGNDLRHGVDCSGFVHHVFRDFGIVLNRTSATLAHNGVFVDRQALLPGDLVFFDTAGGGRISHVGLYIGDGYFIHSSVPGVGGGVIISNLNEAYYARTYRTARRVL